MYNICRYSSTRARVCSCFYLFRLFSSLQEEHRVLEQQVKAELLFQQFPFVVKGQVRNRAHPYTPDIDWKKKI